MTIAGQSEMVSESTLHTCIEIVCIPMQYVSGEHCKCSPTLTQLLVWPVVTSCVVSSVCTPVQVRVHTLKLLTMHFQFA